MSGTETAIHRGVAYPARPAKGRWPLVELLAAADGTGPADLEPVDDRDEAATDRRSGLRAYQARPEELDAWYRSEWSFSWHGQPFRSEGAEGDRITGEYRGEDEQFAKANLRRLVTTYHVSCPLAEATELSEHRTDLLAILREHERRFAESNWFRSGVFAVHEGRTWAADSHPNALLEITISDEGGGEGASRRVSLTDVEAWYTTRWTFTWQGGPFDVLGVEDGLLKGSYTGGQRGFADGYFLDQEIGLDGKRPIYTVRASLESVADLTEQRTDLLARWKMGRQE